MLATPLTFAVESLPTLPRSRESLERQYTNEHSAFVHVGDARIHYREEGNPDGQTLLLIHGTYSSLHTWDEWVEILGDEFHIVRLDMPGFGLTGPRKEGEHSLGYLVDVVGEFCDEVGLSDIVVAGNSLGGGVAWRLQTRRPDLVSGLVLIDSGGTTLVCRIIDSLASSSVLHYALTPIAVRLIAEDAYAPGNSPNPATVRRYYDLLQYPGNREAVREIAKVYRQDYPELCGPQAMIPRPPSWHDPVPHICDPTCISDVDVPTLFLWGSEDSWLPPEFGRELAVQIPGSRFIEYEGVGHAPMEEAPEVSAADARNFIRSLSEQK